MSNETFQQAVGHHQSGRFKEAEGLYRAVLAADPVHPDANHNLGVLALQLKQPAVALPHLKVALDQAPGHHQFWFTYITALTQAGNELEARRTLDQARASGLPAAQADQLERQLNVSLPALQRAVAADPYNASAHSNLGAGLKAAGRADDAVASFRRAIELDPGLAAAHSNLGNTLQGLGRSPEAVASLQQAVKLAPDFAEAHNNLGIALHGLGRPAEAAAAYRNAVRLKPDLVEAHNNLGNALLATGDAETAVACFREAVRLKPDFAAAHNNLGNALQSLGRFEEARTSFERSVALKPDAAVGYVNLGNVLQNLGRPKEAVDRFEHAVRLAPDFTEAWSNLLFTLNGLPDQTPQALLAQAWRFGDLAARKARPFTDWSNDRSPSRRLRVGLVSGDLRAHPVGFYIEGLAAALAAKPDRRIELIAYAGHVTDDDVTNRIKPHCLGWRRTFGLGDEALARMIREDAIDVLIDLSGHTAHNRLTMFAWKPAPVQASWLGYFATTGVGAIDYFIADQWTAGSDSEDHFTEQVWPLPDSYLCLNPPTVDIDVGPLPAASNGCLTFGCFNNLTKLNDETVTLWAQILGAVPKSRLLLRSRQLTEPVVQDAVRARFAALDIEPERVLTEASTTRADYLAAYNRVDISLDPFPYPGLTTSLESLWMGVPVLTLKGDRFLSRGGESIARNAGMSDWIAADAADYLTKATGFAGDLSALADLRGGLRARVLASPLFDTDRFANHFEAAVAEMWARWAEA
jgi:protein O-GlcNAc transferase